jgi:hypothetical protein
MVLAVPKASYHVFMFFTLGHVFGGTRASSLFFTFCAPGHGFGGTNGVGSHFHVLRSRTHFRRCRVRRVSFLCFGRSNSFSQNMKTRPALSLPPKTGLGAQSIKTGPGAFITAENGFGSTKLENGSGSSKHENETRRLRYRRKGVRERKTCKRDPTPSVPPKTGQGVQDIKTAPSVKHENGTRRP